MASAPIVDSMMSFTGGEQAGSFPLAHMLGGDSSAGSAPCIFDVGYKPRKKGDKDDPGKQVAAGVVYCGSREVSVDALDIASTFSGSVYLVVECSNGDFSARLSTSDEGSSETTISRKLYDIEDGSVALDYRCAPTFVLYN